MLLSPRGFMLLLFGSLLLLSCINFVSSEPKVVHMQTERKSRRSLHKRDTKEVVVDQLDDSSLYYVNVSVGNPGQPLSLDIDTGSTDTWMPSAQLATPDNGALSLFFDGNKSSSFALKQDPFNISNGTPGSRVLGQFFTDDLAFDDFKPTNVTMALGQDVTKVPMGILGLGPTGSQSRVMGNLTDTPDKTLLEDMVDQGVISSKSFSLWLNDIDAEQGNILFGGYDNARIDRDLSFLDIVAPQERYTVALTGMALDDGEEAGSLPLDEPLPVILDSGASSMVLPQAIFLQLAYYFGVTNTSDGRYVAPCSSADLPGWLQFQFAGTDGPVISVPFYQLFILSDLTWDDVYGTSNDGSQHESRDEPTGEPTSESQAEPTDQPTSEGQTEPTGEATSEAQTEPTGAFMSESQAEPTDESTSETQADPTDESSSETQAEPTGESTSESQGEPTGEPTSESPAEPTGETQDEPQDNRVCYFGIIPQGDIQVPFGILGDTFLRSAYVFYNLENKQIGIANTLWNVTESDIVEVPAGGAVESDTPMTGPAVTMPADVTREAPGKFGVATADLKLGKPTTAAASLKNAVVTTLGSTAARGHTKDGSGSATSTSAAASSSTKSAAAALAIPELSALPVVLLALCGSMMLMGAFIV